MKVRTVCTPLSAKHPSCKILPRAIGIALSSNIENHKAQLEKARAKAAERRRKEEEEAKKKQEKGEEEDGPLIDTRLSVGEVLAMAAKAAITADVASDSDLDSDDSSSKDSRMEAMLSEWGS